MIVYVLIFNFLIFLRFAFQGRPKARVQLYPLVLLGLFVFSAFRHEVGCDWLSYYNSAWLFAERLSFNGIFLSSEPAWMAVIEGVQALGLPYPWINVASSFIFFLGIHVLARRQPDPLGFLIILFPILIMIMPMSGIRQATSIGIICIAYAAFIDKRLLRFSILVLIATLFHNAAIIFLLLTPLVHGDYSKKRLLWAAILAIPGVLIIFSMEATSLAIMRYVEKDVDAEGAVFRIGLMLATSLFYFIFLQKRWRYAFLVDHKLVTIGSLIMCGLMVIVFFASIIGDRIGYYLIPVQAIILARIPYLLTYKGGAIYGIIPYLILSLVFFAWTLLSGHFDLCYTPYQTWLFNSPELKDGYKLELGDKYNFMR